MAITGASLQPIYDRLHAVSKYHPMSADTFSDWSIEAGDIVTVSRDGDELSAPVHNAKIVWRGSPQVTLNATGKEERDSIARISKKKYGRGGAGMRNDHLIRSEVYSSNSMLYSYIEQTETYILSVVEDVENDLGSSILQTASQIRSEVHASESTLYSYIDQTATYIEQAVVSTESSLRSSIKVQADRISLVVEGTGSGAYIKAAEIVTSINRQTGESQVRIAADKVIIDGATTVNGVFAIENGSLSVKQSAVFKGNVDLTTSGSRIQAPQYSVTSGGKIQFIGTGQGETYDITTTILKGMIKSFSVSGNTLTLTPFYGQPVDFNKAVSLSGGWSGGIYSVSATTGTISGQAPSTTLFDLGLGTATKGTGSTVEATYDIGYQAIVGGQAVRGGSTGKTGTLSLNVSGLLENRTGANKIDSNNTYTPSPGFIGFGSIEVDVPQGGSASIDAINGTAVGDVSTDSANPFDITASGTNVTSKTVQAYVSFGGWNASGKRAVNVYMNYVGGSNPGTRVARLWISDPYSKSVTLTYKGSVNGVYTYTTSTYVSGLTVDSRYTVHFNT